MDDGEWLLVSFVVIVLALFIFLPSATIVKQRRYSQFCEFTGGNLVEDVSVDCGGYSYMDSEGRGAPWACASDGKILWFIEAGSHDVITYEEFCGD